MSHYDQDALSLLALGESASESSDGAASAVDAVDEAHLSECAQCQTELDALRSVVDMARIQLRDVVVRADDGRDATDGQTVTRLSPPPRVWERIAAATGVTTQARPELVARDSLVHTPGDSLVHTPGDSLVHTPGDSLVHTPGDADEDVADDQAQAAPAKGLNGSAAHSSPVSATVTPIGLAAPAGREPATPDVVKSSSPDVEPVAPQALPSVRQIHPEKSGRRPPPQRRRDTASLIGIAAVALIIGGLGGAGVTNWVQNRPPSVTSPSVVAGTSLNGLTLAPAAAGNASIVQTSDGRLLDVDVRRLNPADGFYEVWLINSDITKMVSVGVLQGSSGQFVLPAGIDLSQFPLVDVSIQSYQGSGAHSGKSVLRGTLHV